MRPETRFVGNGNAWIGNGHYRGWRITCSRCAAEKVVSSHHGSSLPPEAIVKTLVKSGWHIGRGPEEDLCVGCRKKKPVANKPLPVIETSSPAAFFEQLRYTVLAAKRQLAAKQYFFVADNIDTALRSLDPTVTAAVIAAMTPPKPKSEPKVEAVVAKTETPPKVESDDDYQKWLTTLDNKEEGA